MKMYHVIGLMSGTSLDGLDIAYCCLTPTLSKGEGDKWNFEIKKATTIKYSDEWKKRLSDLENKSAVEFAQTHVEYGHYIGKLVSEFVNKNKLLVDFVSSHGHTIFHQPEKKFTFQIGSGAAIAAECKLPVVCDFRSLDVALGGQGAPLVPIGDKFLFEDYDFCLNLGGFANVTSPPSPLLNKERGVREVGVRSAYDICPVNIVLNQLVSTIGKDYDDKGQLAKSGNLNSDLLNELNNLSFYTQKPPKSLGKEWVLKNINPILNKYSISIEDKLRTVIEHTAIQITDTIKSQITNHKSQILITGGGAYNNFLISRIKALSQLNIIIPPKEIIEYKEALIFAFLGVLRMRNEINCLKSVTGASIDNVGGAVYWAK